MKKIIISLMAVMITVGLVGIGTYAIFSDTETSLGNTFTAGTLDLTVNDKDGPSVVSYTFENMKPGDEETVTFWLENVGTIKDVKARMQFDITQNLENGCNEPEGLVDATCGTPGDGEGELAGVLMTEIYFNGGFATRGNLSALDAKEEFPLPPWQSDWYKNEVRLNFSIDSSVGNIIQGDACTVDITFALEQK